MDEEHGDPYWDEDNLETQAWILFRCHFHHTLPGNEAVERAMNGLFDILKDRDPNWVERLTGRKAKEKPVLEDAYFNLDLEQKQRKIDEIDKLLEKLDPDDYSIE